jgi:DNA-binding XRE family transcriptional regulator
VSTGEAMPPPSKLRHNLARARRDVLKVTQAQLAKWVGCSPVTIQSIEAGRLALSDFLAARIEQITGVSAEWLLKNDLKSGPPLMIRRWLDNVINQDNTRKKLFLAFYQALKSLERQNDIPSVTLFEHYLEEYCERLKKVFGDTDAQLKSTEEIYSYLQEQLDKNRSVSKPVSVEPQKEGLRLLPKEPPRIRRSP